MLDFERKTEAVIQRHQLLQREDLVLVAVSGGPDSLALLDFLVKRKDMYGIQVAAVHVDHMFRGEDSLRDLEFVQSCCDVYGIECKATSIDIRKKMHIDRTGMQETARKYRYQYFEKEMNEIHAHKLAVAQHGDDQIETILMRLTRGSRGKARAGIQLKRPFAKGEMIRPLLGVTKEEIEAYCTSMNLQPRQDPSNAMPVYTRNRFRIEMIPFLKSQNEHVHEHFQRFSQDLTEDEDYLLELTEREMNIVWQYDREDITLNIPKFHQVPLPLQRRGIHLILNYLYQQNAPDLTALHIDLIQQLLKSENPSGKLDLPHGLKVIRSYELCRFTFAESLQSTGYHYELYDGEEASLPNGNLIRVEQSGGFPSKDRKNVFVFDPTEIQFPIVVRTRHPGDRMKIKGMNGTKKIKDIFIDLKIPLTRKV